MFERGVLKRRAKEVLSLNYWNIFIVILISVAASSVISGVIAVATGSGTILNREMISVQRLMLYSFAQLTSAGLSLAVSALILLPVQVGINKYVLELSAKSESNLDRLLYVFRNNYTGIATVLFVKALIITVLSLLPALFVTIGGFALLFSENLLTVLIMLIGWAALIPLMLKTYDYYLVEFILTEKPEISWREALAESKMLMRGNRFKVFVLNLSFLGWFLLGALALGVGMLFVIPYVAATDAQLYLELSGKNKIDDETEGV